ncbi:helix-turn-helix transcriptional regulator [Halorussus litoreus]|uniref:helix-turn-helix transcriptional regulator n=1 Tax=Halorussus litoreus TaxID=1710536 RepID=UPI0013009D93|nr:hypothetical protein [Halorussus litoreus]
MRSSAALLVGVLLVISAFAGVGAGQPGQDPARSPSAAPAPSAGLSVSPPVGPSYPRASLGSPTTGPTSLTATPDASTGPHDTSVGLHDNSVEPHDVNSSANVTANDGTEMYVTVNENGDARWSVTAQFVLDDDNETAAFRQLQRDYRNGTTDAGFTRETFVRALDRAATDTDRSMEIRNVSRSGSLAENGSVGTLSLSFTWTNFAAVDGNRIAFGDVFWVGTETWLPALTADQSLTIEGPPGYYVESSRVPISGGSRIHFEGPRTFETGDFSVTYAPKQTVTTTTGPPSTTATTTDGFPDISGTSGLIVVLVVFGIGFGAYAMSQRRGPDPDVDESSVAGGSPASAPTADASGEDEHAAGDDESTEDADEDGPPTELLSDEERVLRLLRDNDGRMKQADIVTETNWSNAKVSQLLSKMNDNGEVDKLRIGRENLITLPDEDVTDFD